VEYDVPAPGDASRRPKLFSALALFARRLKIAGPAQQAVQFVGRDHGQSKTNAWEACSI
jgi:hypothetical protein